MNIEIIPACMPRKFDEIESAAGSVRGFVKTIQLDLMDGKYAPEATWPFMYEVDYIMEEMKKEDGGFPFWESIDYELDLMVERPEERLDDWLHIGASRVIFHYASVHDWEKIKSIDPVIRNFTKIGLAVTIHDNLEEIFPLLDESYFDFVQVMGINQIGYMGEPFDEKAFDIIAEIKKRYPEMILSIDGGVSDHNLLDLYNAGVDRFVSGSAVFGQGLASENIEYLEDILEA